MDQLPLQFPHVFQKILEGLPITALLNCRLVNKSWNFEANKLLQEKCTTSFDKCESLRDYCQTFKRYNDSSIQLKSFHFTIPFFHRTSTNEKGVCNIEKYLSQFISMNSEKVIKLRISTHYPLKILPMMTFSHDILFSLIYSFPNLTILHLTVFIPDIGNIVISFLPDELRVVPKQDLLPKLTEFTFHVAGCETTYEKYKRFFNPFTKNLLQSSPNLKVLGGNFCSSNPFVKNISVIPSNLTSLKLVSLSGEKNIEGLILTSFPKLEKLLVSLDMDFVSENSLKTLRIKYSGTLKVLEVQLQAPWTSQSMPPDGIVMKDLDTLAANNYCGPINWDGLPKLKRLQINNRCIDWQQFFPKSESKWSLKSLEIGPEKFSNQLELPNWFCYLTELKINTVKGAQLRDIFGSCQLLKNLHVDVANLIGDNIISGLSLRSMRVLSPLVEKIRNYSGKWDVQDVLFEATWKKRDFPFLGDLKDLQDLSLGGHELKISDVSVLFGVAQCGKLRRLKFKSNRITWRSALILRFGARNLVRCEIN